MGYAPHFIVYYERNVYMTREINKSTLTSVSDSTRGCHCPTVMATVNSAKKGEELSVCGVGGWGFFFFYRILDSFFFKSLNQYF